MSKNVYLASKPRFDILDGLRGVAAVIVVAFHLFETYSKGPNFQILNHGYLAVDFFFVLSGFVIGYAYDDRWDRMSLGNFFKRRLIRLHPMVIMGMIIGLVFFYFQAPAFPMIAGIPVWKTLLVFLLGCTLIPLPIAWDIRGWSEMHPLNGASWSLFWEYVANILYALVIRHLPRWVLIICVGAFAFLSLDLNMDFNVFGLLTEGRSYAAYTPIGGWSINAEQCYIGMARLLYPFFMGLLLSRFNARINIRKGGFWWTSLIVAVVLCFPYIGSEAAPWANGIFNSLAILVIFPLIVAMGAGSTVNGEKSSKFCKFLGEISFPLYITHFPLIYLQMACARSLESMNAPMSAHVLMSVCIGIFAIALAWAALKLYDIPVRNWLTDRMKARMIKK